MRPKCAWWSYSPLVVLLSFLGFTMALAACSMAPPSNPSGALEQGVYWDNFETDLYDWPARQDERGRVGYRQGQYEILVTASNTFIWAVPNRRLDFPRDVAIEVDVERLDGPADNTFGVICRYQDEQNFYFFLISSDGYHGIGKMLAGEQSLISQSQLAPTDGFTPQDRYHLRVECDGNRLSLYVDGALSATPLYLTEMLESQQEDVLSEGSIGLIAGTYDIMGTHIVFENLAVFGR